jgi:hypothetical protein
MNRMQIAFLVAAVFTLTLTAQEASSASFGPVGALKQSTVGTNPVQEMLVATRTVVGVSTGPGTERFT